MTNIMKLAVAIAAGAAIAVGVGSAWQTTPVPVAPDSESVIVCGICSGPFFQNGQICFLYSCNNGPCDTVLCLKF